MASDLEPRFDYKECVKTHQEATCQKTLYQKVLCQKGLCQKVNHHDIGRELFSSRDHSGLRIRRSTVRGLAHQLVFSCLFTGLDAT